MEGWVLVKGVVATDGTVSEVIVLDSDPPNTFEKAATRAAKKWKFEPATLNDENVSGYFKVVLTFELLGSHARLTEGFKRKLKAAGDALENNQLAEAEKQIDGLVKERWPVLLEDYYISYLRAQLAVKQGDTKEAIWQINQAIETADVIFVDKAPSLLYRQLFLLEIERRHFANALDAYEKMTQIEQPSPEDPLTGYHKSMLKVIEGNKPLLYSAIIDDTCGNCAEEIPDWYHHLYRNAFSIETAQGKIDTIEVRCEQDWERYHFTETILVHVMDGKKMCEVRVFGEEGTTFDFAEVWAQE